MRTTASPAEVWVALPAALWAAFARPRARWLAAILRCDDDGPDGGFGGMAGESLAGFRVARSEASRELALEGRHQYSRYRLTFEIEPEESGARVRAVTHAAFPGLRGTLYRALVVGSGGHRVVTRRMLKSVARRAERAHSHRKEEA